MNVLRICLFYLVTSVAIAAPGAHGPNGEHLDAPGVHVRNDAAPHIETFTESFELVGHLRDGELSVLIDRYETNEPVLNGKLEVEFNGLKAPAKFHADHGDYAVDDENFLKALAKPGQHALLFTLSAGEEGDLLEGTLEVNATANRDGHSHDDEPSHGYSLTTWAIVGVLVAVLLIAVVFVQLRRKTATGK